MREPRTLDDFLEKEKYSSVEKVKFRGISIWGYLRNYYSEKYLLSKERSNRPSQSLALKGFFNLFKGWANWFRRYDYIAIVSKNQRKVVDGVYVHPLDQIPSEYAGKTLFIELNNLDAKVDAPYPKKRRVVSRFALVLMEFFLIRLLPNRYYSSVVSSLTEIEEDLEVALDKMYLLRRFDAAYIVMRRVLKMYRPKAMFCMVSYPIAGYILAAKNLGIPVIELQHGYIGRSHRAYNVPKSYGDEIYPDYFLSWGNYEVDFFKESDGFFISSNKVFPVGNYFLENYLEERERLQKEFLSRFKDFDIVVSVSMQDPLEAEIMEMVMQAAPLDHKIVYLLLPRSKSDTYYQEKYNLGPNIVQVEKINTYQGMLISQVHSTMWSTTAFEGLAMGLPNVLIDSSGRSHDIFGHLLNKREATFYADTPQEYVGMIRDAALIDQREVKEISKYYFADDFSTSIKDAVDTIL